MSRRDLVRRMNDAIIHRGPDEDGYFEDEQVAIAEKPWIAEVEGSVG